MTRELQTTNEIGLTRILREKAIKTSAAVGFEKRNKAWEAFNIWMEQEEAMVERAKDFHPAQLRLNMKTALFYEKIGYKEAAIDAYNNAWHHAHEMQREDLCLYCEAKLIKLGSDVMTLDGTGWQPKYISVLTLNNRVGAKLRARILNKRSDN